MDSAPGSDAWGLFFALQPARCLSLISLDEADPAWNRHRVHRPDRRVLCDDRRDRQASGCRATGARAAMVALRLPDDGHGADAGNAPRMARHVPQRPSPFASLARDAVAG